MGDPSYSSVVKNAAHYKAIGQTQVYLFGEPLPWGFVTKVEAGGSHRLDMDTSVRFTAVHPCGITFDWSFDIEVRDANGKGYYEINSDAVSRVMASIPAKAKKLFASYLYDCAAKVKAKGLEYQEHANRQGRDAAILLQLAEKGAK